MCGVQQTIDTGLYICRKPWTNHGLTKKQIRFIKFGFNYDLVYIIQTYRVEFFILNGSKGRERIEHLNECEKYLKKIFKPSTINIRGRIK